MVPTNRIAQICWLFVAALTGLTSPNCGQTTGDGKVLNSRADENVAIRFFFQPPGDYFHVPLIFRVEDLKDPRYNTAPILDSGRTAYISLSDMQRLLPAVTHLSLLWRHAETGETFGSSRVLQLAGIMDITILSSHGTARAALDPKKICETLSPMDAALKTPRALWEFQLFRTAYGCRVPGFNYDAYPDHW